MVFTDSSICVRSSRELFKLSLEAAVDNLNSFRAESKSFVVLDCIAVAEHGGLREVRGVGAGGGLAAVLWLLLLLML